MDEIAVVNASPLIFFSRSKRLALLQDFFHKILVPAPVAEEIAVRGANDITAQSIAGTAQFEVIPSPPISGDIVAWGLGPGESSVLAIAQANPGMTAILDDLSGRKCAAILNIPVRGTLGIVLAARRRGQIQSARLVMDELITSGLYLSRRVLDEAMERAGE